MFVQLDPESENIVREMQSLMEKVEEMRSQRAMLTSQLRDSICKDDITQLLVTHPNENFDSLFQEELKKHQDVVSVFQSSVIKFRMISLFNTLSLLKNYRLN